MNDVCRAIKGGVDYVARNGKPNPGQGDRVECALEEGVIHPHRGCQSMQTRGKAPVGRIETDCEEQAGDPRANKCEHGQYANTVIDGRGQARVRKH